MTEVKPGPIVAGVLGGLLFLLILAAVVARLIQPKNVPRVVRSVRVANEKLHPTAQISPRIITSDEFLPKKTYFDDLHEHSSALRRQSRLTNHQMAETSLTGRGPRYTTII